MRPRLAPSRLAALALPVLAILALAVPPASPQDAPRKRDLKDRQEIAGKIVCIGCTLQALPGGADSQCTLHAKHAQGLLLPDGTLWTFVDNARGHPVLANAKLRDREVKVLGWKFPKAQYVELWRYDLREGESWVAFDWCRNCGFEKGNHGDKDLCEDCEKE